MAFSLTNNKLANYLKASRDEMRKVTWPTKQVVIRDTLVVIGFSISLAVFFGVIDYGLSKGLAYLIAS
jgi:preprotein translocase subunit SecE